MSTRFFAHWATWAAAFAAVLFAVPAWAQAPGEDPVVLTKKLTIQMQPRGGSGIHRPGQRQHDAVVAARPHCTL